MGYWVYPEDGCNRYWESYDPEDFGVSAFNAPVSPAEKFWEDPKTRLTFLAGGDEELRAQISEQKLLTTLRAFLEGNTHYPDKDSGCDGCVALGMIEEASDV